MFGIALDLGGTPHMTFHQDTVGKPAQGHGCGEKERLAWHGPLRGADIRHDLFFRLAGAGTQTGQRQRGPHELQKATSADGIVPFRCLLRELTVQELLELLQSPPVLQDCASIAALAPSPGECGWQPGRVGWSSGARCSSMTHRARGKFGNVIFLHQPPSQGELVFRRLPIHAKHILTGSDKPLRLSVTLQAPFHVQ